jgi:hypothetical protein
MIIDHIDWSVEDILLVLHEWVRRYRFVFFVGVGSRSFRMRKPWVTGV